MVSASNNGGGEQRREGRASSSSSRRVVLENLQMAFHYSTFKTQRRTLLSALTTFFVLFLLGRIRRLEQKASAAGLEKQVGKLMTCMSFWPQADIKAIRPENTHVITKRASTKNALPREYIVRPHFFLSQTKNFISFLFVSLNSNKKFFFRTRKKLDCPGWTRVWVYPWVPAAGK